MKKSKLKLVSINIPTYNSEETIRRCLESVKAQTYENIEIIIIDSYSQDKTLDIAEEFGAKILKYQGKLLGARELGVRESKGKFILLLDSDQILEKTAIERGVNLLEKYDMLWLYERAYNRKKWLPSLYDADRILVLEYMVNGIDLLVVLPRFFKTELLIKIFKNIPKKAIPFCSAQDHIITTYEAKKLSKKMGFIGTKEEPSVQHIEPDNLTKLIKKQYRWGKVTREFLRTGFYSELIEIKHKYRRFDAKNLELSVQSFILRTLRGIPYFVGYTFARK